MTIRFRKRIRLFGGLAHLNLSRGGISFSAGPNGANVNFDLSGRRKHPRATLGLPGTGLFYQADLKGHQQEPQQVPATVGTEFASLVVKQLQQKRDDSPPNGYIPPPLASDGRRKSVTFWATVIILVTIVA